MMAKSSLGSRLPNEFPAKVHGKGKITIPRIIREICDINDGDIVTLSVLEVAHKGGK